MSTHDAGPVDWDALAARVQANFAATGQWFAPDGPVLPPTETVDWDALAAQVQASFAATGQWFVGDTAQPPPPAAEPDAGTAGDDSIAGTATAEELRGLAGDDTILAGAGDDTVSGDDIEAGPFPGEEPGPGRNLILGEAGNDRITAGWGADTVFGGAGDDSVTGHGGTSPSPAGFEFLLRQSGPDLLSGEEGKDTLVGGGAADTLLGGAGDDLLSGLYGADLLSGGAGADRFAFRGLDPFGSSPDTGVGEGNRDVIIDFGQGEDVIDLSGYRSPGGPGAVFLGTEAFAAASDRLQVRYEIAGDRTVVQFRDAGDEPSPTGEIELLGAYALTGEDFLL